MSRTFVCEITVYVRYENVLNVFGVSQSKHDASLMLRKIYVPTTCFEERFSEQERLIQQALPFGRPPAKLVADC